MRGVFAGVRLTVALAAAAAAWVWFYAPGHLPAEWRRRNPNSDEYRPTLYRWKDDQGRTQVSDTPPAGRAYETVQIDPRQNVVPGRNDPAH